jgi:cold shock CspA family protein
MNTDTNTDTTSSGNIDTTSFYFGRVKWFNNKAGYGFVTIVGDAGSDRVGEDVFVHHTGIKVDSEQYKYLVQGEYTYFNLKESDSESHPFQAHNLTGLWGGWLMCETRNDQRQQRDENGENDDDGHRKRESSDYPRDRRRRHVRSNGSGPRDDGMVWALVQPNRGGNSRRTNTKRDRHEHN